ncbi:unnamed protein product, partial [Ectocarpus sp. 13 AM-2016]
RTSLECVESTCIWDSRRDQHSETRRRQRDNSDGRHRWRCFIAGGAVAGVLVVGAAILAVLVKAGRLKTRGSSRKRPTYEVAPVPSSGPVPIGRTRVEAAAAPIARQCPAAYQYPHAIVTAREA